MTASSRTSKCLICNSETHELLDPQMKVTYDCCQECGFISKQKEFFLDKETEKGRYDLHNNDDEGYKKSFDEVINDYIKKLDIKTVLDYGSGPYPVLTELLKDTYEVSHFDPFYNNDKSYQHKQYDLVVLSEVIEHMHNPRLDLSHILGLLKKNKYLIIMTHLRNVDETKFLTWWYRRDRTHVGFYMMQTFETIATLFNLKLIQTNNKNIIVLQKLGD